jgi:hypothetical protein
MAYTKYSLTPANNTAAPPDGAPEGMLPSAVNDTMRDMMAQIRDAGDGIRDGTYTMTAPKITGGTITGATLTGNTFTSPVISGGSINNTPIGATTASTGAFSTLSATGVTTVQAGTVSLPAITTSGDTNTGIYFPAADTIGLTVGGVESARVVSGLLSIPANSTAPSAVRLYEDTDNGTNYVDLIASAAITSNRTLTIPDETGTIITTGSSGQSIPKAALPTGSVLQVVSTAKTDTFSTSSTSFTDITGLSVSITPTSATSKILIMFSVPASSSSSSGWYLNLVRNSTDIIVADTAGSRVSSTISTYIAPTQQSFSMAYQYLDSPTTTSATTYKLQLRAQSGFTAFVNQTATDVNNSDYNRATSSLTVMEIAA